MTKFALLKKVSFNVTNTNVSLYLSDKVSFHEFNGTINLFNKIHEFFGNMLIDILNCDYNETYLLQAFFLENTEDDVYENMIIVKRKINKNDKYVFTTEKELIENDTFEYTDVTYDDIETILLKKYHTEGVQIEDDDTLTNIKYNVKYDHENHTGKLNITVDNLTHSITFLNYPSLVKSYEKDNLNSEQMTSLVSTKISETGAQYFYTQKEFKLGLLNCYCPIYGQNKNEIMSKLLEEIVCGNCYVGLENHLNDDTRILSCNSDIIKKILKFMETKDYKIKNPHFCNIFYELNDL